MLERYAAQGLRVLAVARRRLPDGAEPPARREDAERELCLLGLVALFDPPRPEVAEAVAQLPRGRHPHHRRHRRLRADRGGDRAPGRHRRATAATVIDRRRARALSERELDELLREGEELIFARTLARGQAADRRRAPRRGRTSSR